MNSLIDIGGFYLVQLEVTGLGKLPAVVDFTDGLNVIFGASDTGKSYIIQAIDYLLGGENPPKNIPQAEGYDCFKLTIHSRKQDVDIQIIRKLGAKKVQVNNDTIPLKASTLDKNSLSNFLLDLCGLKGTRLLKNVRGEVQNLSFRTLSHILLIDETAIIKDEPPILSPGRETQHTVEFALVKYLLTEKIYENLAIHTADEKKAAKVSINLLDELKRTLEDKRKALSIVETDALLTQKETLQHTIDKLLEELAIKRSIIDELERQYSTKAQEKTKIVAQLEENKISLNRFSLLQKYYQSDEERIETLGQALITIFTMDNVACPICGALGEHQRKKYDEFPVENIEATMQAEAIESGKLEADLSLLIVELDSKHKELLAKLNQVEHDIAESSTEIEILKKSNHDTFQKDLADAIAVKSKVENAISLEFQIKDFEKRIATQKKVVDSEDAQETAKLSAAEAAPLIVEIRHLLKVWGFDPEKVSFSDKKQDILIEDVLRSSHGKGVKALGCTAYIIGLMEACLKHKHKHPSFVVIDSPLVTYKPPKKGESGDGPDKEMPQNIIFNLYNSLSKNILGQIIILENTEVPTEINTNKIFFSGESNTDTRYGFFPM